MFSLIYCPLVLNVEKIGFQVHSGRLNIAGWNMNTYFLLLLQHVQYFHCYVSLHEASHRFFLNNVSGVKRIFQITPALADIFPSVGFAEILASIFFQKVKEDVKQQKDEAKWINEIVSLMVDGWFLFVCLWGCTFTFLQMGHILTFIQTNVSCFFFGEGPFDFIRDAVADSTSVHVQ